jgi:glycosyltransferase involved in cell wall biosynthesis
MYEALDQLVAYRLERCDVFIGMSGICVKSAMAAKQKYGAKVLIERGSRHILSQKAILDSLAMSMPKADSVPDYAVQRELASYEIADAVVVPSRHVVESFLAHGFPQDKLFRNPYGVDLGMFPPTYAPPFDSPTILFVGNWSLQKGCDVLVRAWRKLQGVRLIHVGSVGDASLPRDPNFTHYDAMPQWKLAEIYAQAHVFVLASRQEGLSMVQAQALASGLPIVCTTHTGGEDLQELLDDPKWVTVVPVEDADALAQGIQSALQLASKQRGIRDVLGQNRKDLNWGAYGKRYDQFLRDCLSKDA